MVSHRGPWPFISKVGVYWCNLHKLLVRKKSTNLSVYLYHCNQIHHQIGYMGQFVHIMWHTSYWCHTEASWLFISKVRTSGCNLHKFVSRQKSTNFSFLLYDCNQIHYKISYTVQFVHIICNASYLISLRGLMTIYFESRGR